ncbi:MAG TPA: transcription termination/antitermination NusG family protein [Planctomycetia bacterium]|nr:transcription termination/antitermination NusG family protein [Planctomycetia bacterium]
MADEATEMPDEATTPGVGDAPSAPDAPPAPDETAALPSVVEPETPASAAEAPAALDAAAEKEEPAAPPFEPKPKSANDCPEIAWYVLKEQSNREESIRDAILRRLKIASLDQHVDEVIVPIEKVLEIKDGKKKVVKRKLYPGYVFLSTRIAEEVRLNEKMTLNDKTRLNDEVWFTIRDTPGVGHFVHSGDKPLPMSERDVEKMLKVAPDKGVDLQKVEDPKTVSVPFNKGDRVVIKEGPFENFEGDVDEVHADKGTVRVMIQIFGRPTPVDVEYWQVGLVRT